MTERAPSACEAARLLRQRLEMGESELFLRRLTRKEAVRALKGARLGAGGPAGAPGQAGARKQAGAAATAGDRPPGGRRSGSAEQAAGTPSRAEERGETSSGGRRAGSAAGEEEVPPWEVGLRQGARRTVGSESSSSGPAAKEAAPAALPVLPDTYEELRDVALGCTRCRLAGSRTQVVFSDGSPTARLMVVGEAPGANEDETGLPFVGAAGKFLDLLLATIGLSRRDSVYICNVLKCRPPGNRNPSPDEIEACSPFLRKQIEVVGPEAILAVGSFAAQLLTAREGSALGRLRGEVHAYEGVPLVVTYHPAALLRNANWTRAFWDDLQLLRSVLDGPSEHR